MNIKNKMLLPAILLFAACASPEERGVTITGDIKGLEAGELIYYAPQQDQQNSQTVVAEAGKFTIHIPVAAGQGDWYRVWIGASPLADNLISVYVDSGEVKLTGSEGGFKDVQYSGKPYTDEYNDFQQLAKKPGIDAQQWSADARQWIAERPASVVGTALLGMLQSNGAMHKDTVISLFGKRDAASMNNQPANRIKEWMTLTADIMPGKPAPVFTMADTSGKMVSLSDFKGKYVLLDFWASWCGPCRKENPHLVKAFADFKDKGFTIIGVSLDRPGDAAKWLAAVHKDQLTWTHLSDLKYFDNEAAKRYHIQSIPSNFLLDPNGVIIARDLRGEGLHQKLAEVFPM